MFLKLQKMGYCIHKLERLTMRARKSGKMNRMIQSLISGLWDVLFTK
jgi:hypothetical protein